MSEVVPYLVTVGCLVTVMGFLTWLKGVLRRRGIVGSAVRGALASYEEAMRVTAYESHHEVRAQADRQAPVVSPDGPWWVGRGAARETGPGRTARRRGTGRLRRPRRRWRR